MAVAVRLLPLLAGLWLSACTPLAAHRTATFTPQPAGPFADTSAEQCNPSENAADASAAGTVDDVCADRVREDSAKYRLYFSEYDDQGWSYHDGAEDDPARLFSQDLQALLKNPDEKVSVVVFVHGWKHNAAYDDSNVRAFRRLLSDLREVELQSGAKCGRRVVGVYVGWRGRTGDLGPLENASFWNRKEAAQRVALGDVRMLFSDLREIQDKANVQWNAALDKASPAAQPGADAPVLDPCRKRMKLSVAGHSFGGLIVYTSIAQSLIRDIVALRHDEALQADAPASQRTRPRLQREGDLVVVINPAIEATRFHPLFRAASEAGLPHYHTPIFVSITSHEDTATRRAFPVGRWFSTFWDKYPDDRSEQEEQANLYTFGHADDFVTHLLTAPEGSELPTGQPCHAWKSTDPFADRLAVEAKNLAEFRDRLDTNGHDARGIGTRYFCGSQAMQLMVKKGLETWAGNSPVWNIRTGKPIIDDHNDFSNPLLLEMLRQLYVEAEERSFVRQRTSK